MASTLQQLILSIRALSSSGLAPAEIFQSSQFTDLLTAVDTAIDSRSKVVSALRKRKREENAEEDELALRKRKLLKKIDEAEEYEVFRQQQWVQYYDWLSQQQKQPIAVSSAVQEKLAEPEPSTPLADDDIDAQLLGF